MGDKGGKNEEARKEKKQIEVLEHFLLACSDDVTVSVSIGGRWDLSVAYVRGISDEKTKR